MAVQGTECFGREEGGRGKGVGVGGVAEGAVLRSDPNIHTMRNITAQEEICIRINSINLCIYFVFKSTTTIQTFYSGFTV